MIRTVIVDDQPEIIDLLRDYLSSSVEVVGTASDPKEGIKTICEKRPELVFIDVCMPGFTGFDVLERCAPADFEKVIISAHEQYALNAFRHHAFHYLLKPFSDIEVSETVNRIINQKRQTPPQTTPSAHGMNSITVSNTEGIHIVPVNTIVRCEAEGSYTTILLHGNNKLLASHPIGFYEKQLKRHGFLRVHKSHLINLEEIKFIDHTGGVSLKNDNSRIQIAMRRRRSLMQFLSNAQYI